MFGIVSFDWCIRMFRLSLFSEEDDVLRMHVRDWVLSCPGMVIISDGESVVQDVKLSFDCTRFVVPLGCKLVVFENDTNGNGAGCSVFYAVAEVES